MSVLTAPPPVVTLNPKDRQKLEDVGFMTCMTLTLLGNYAQTGHFGGPLAWGLEAERPEGLFAFAADELADLLGSSFRKRIEPVAASAWGQDPWSRGAYSHALPGHADDRARLKTPIENRIFVAGEATADAFYGTAHGAWMECERAAREALTALGLAGFGHQREGET